MERSDCRMRYKCRDCGKVFDRMVDALKCPNCGSYNVLPTNQRMNVKGKK